MNKKVVSVIIRTVDRPEMLKKALQSVYLQTYSEVEAVIVNDGGPSLKEFLAQEDQLPDYQLIEFETNQGRSNAANRGIQSAQGEFVNFLDDDDILYPNHISLLAQQMGDNDHIVYSDALKSVQQPQGEDYKTIKHILSFSEEHTPEKMFIGNFIPIQCLLFRRKALLEDMFDPGLDVLEDWDLLIRLTKKYPFKYIRQITSEFTFRTDKTNTTGNNQDLWDRTGELIKERYNLN